MGCAYRAYVSEFQVKKMDQNLFKREVEVRLPYLLMSSSAEEVFGIHLSEASEKGDD